MSLVGTPQANRIHIGIYGRRNTGKSSLINALTGQNIALVSNIAGTTTDPVYKAMEIHGIGPVIFIDTPGFDDSGELGEMRVNQSKKTIQKIDMALLLFDHDNIDIEIKWFQTLKRRGVQTLAVVNKIDQLDDPACLLEKIKRATGLSAILINAKSRRNIDQLVHHMIGLLPEDFNPTSITGDLIKESEVVVLVMPQDIEAPQGRLILPQVQTIRELLDKKCIPVCTTTDRFQLALRNLKTAPPLIITDSSVFDVVYALKPTESKLTSFSILFAGYKGDTAYFLKSAKALDHLPYDGRILIAEACTHAPLEEDIGRVKLPTMLRKRYGDDLRIQNVAGSDFPQDLKDFDLIIHCGSCMFNRKLVLSRVNMAKSQNVPMTNYGVVIAYLQGILDKISFPS